MMGLTWRWFVRSTRRGDYLWLWLAVMLASSSVMLIEQLAQSVRATMLAQTVTSMGAPLMLRSTQPIDAIWQQRATQTGLQTGSNIQFNTMLVADDRFQLVSVHALSAHHPDRRWVSFPDAVQHPLVIDAALSEQLSLTVGQSLTLGNQVFSIVGINSHRDPFSMIANQFAPPVYIPIEQLDDLGLLGTGSLASYEMSFSGNAEAIAQLSAQLTHEKQAVWQIVLAEKQNEDLDNTLQTAWIFLDMAALTSVLIAGLSILIASRFYLQKWLQTLALLRALGVKQRQLLWVFGGQLMLLALIASVLGVALGGMGFAALMPLLSSWLPNFTTTSPLSSMLLAALSGSVIFWVFALPMFWRMMQTQPQQLFRNTSQAVRQQLLAWLFSLGLLAVLLSILLPTRLSGWVLLALGVVGIVLWSMAWLLQTFLFRLQGHTHGWLRLAIANLKQDPLSLKLQFIAFGLVLYLLLLLTFVHQQLVSHWQASLSSDAPNIFVMAIQPDNLSAVQQQLKSVGLDPAMIPMLRGRLIQHNERHLSPENFPIGRIKRILEHEANVAVLSQLPDQNVVVAALAPAQHQADLPAISVEKGVAELFHMALGDRLVFDVQGQAMTFEVNAIREVRWQTLQPNFFFIAQPFAGDALPITYLTSFHSLATDAANKQLKSGLQSAASGAMWVDVGALIAQVQQIMQQAGQAISFLYVFALLASVLVVLSATLAAQESRYRQWLVLKTLGAKQQTLLLIGLGEYVLIGLLAGSMAAILAQLTQQLIAVYWLKLPTTWDFTLWGVSLLLGAGSLLVIAWLSQRSRLSLTPKQLMQKVSQS